MGIKKYVLLIWGVVVLSAGLLILSSWMDGFQIDQDLILPILLAYVTVGGLVASRQPKNAIGWLFLSGVLVLSANSMMGWYANLGLQVLSGVLPGMEIAAAFTNGMGNLGFGLLLLFPTLIFPNGQLLSRRWRPVAWLVGLILGLSILEIFRPGSMTFFPGLENPLGIEQLAGYYEFTRIWSELIITPIYIACPISLILRYRRASLVERQQIKWVAYSAGLVGLIIGLMLVISPLLYISEVWFNLIWLLLVMSIPISIGIAILRYRLFDIDFIIRKTLVYGALTLTLALVYFGSVVLLQTLFEGFSGERSPVAIVVSTLGIAALFTPLRRRVQEAIDRRFYRRKYDAARALESFAASARDETDVGRLKDELVELVQETVQPEQLGLWMRPITSEGIDRSENMLS